MPNKKLTRKAKAGTTARKRIITKRKRADESLRIHSLVLRSMAEAVIYTDPRGIIRFSNQASDRIFGYEPGELIGQPMSLLNALPPEQYARRVAGISETIRNGEIWEGESLTRRKDGTVIHTRARVNGMRHAGKIRAVVVQDDITEQKMVQEALRDSEARFRTLTDTIEEVFWMADNKIENILYISPGYERIWGRSRQSLYDDPMSFAEAIHPQDRDDVLDNLRASIEGRPFDLEYRIVRPDGSIRWIWDRGFPVQSETGVADRYAGVALDITERKRAENEIRKLNAELEQRVMERTAELNRSHEKLRALTVAMESVQEEERKRIARELHDDLTQKLAVLKLQLRLMKSELTADAPSLSAKIAEMNQLLDETTNGVRRIAAGLRPAVLDELGLAIGLEELVDEFGRWQNIDCEFSVHPADLAVDTPLTSQLYRMVQESLNNIARHAQATKVIVSLHGDPSGRIILNVDDNGRGISDEDQHKQKAFGLIGMRERVVALGGEMLIRGKSGVGTSIEIAIPHSPNQPLGKAIESERK